MYCLIVHGSAPKGTIYKLEANCERTEKVWKEKQIAFDYTVQRPHFEDERNFKNWS